MARFDFAISATAEADARAIGLVGSDVRDQLRQMIAQAATTWHPEGRYRYMRFLFDVREGAVIKVSLLPPNYVTPPKREEWRDPWTDYQDGSRSLHVARDKPNFRTRAKNYRNR